VLTSYKVRLPSYVGSLDDLPEKPEFPDKPGVGSAEPWILNRPEVSSEKPPIPLRHGGGWEVFGGGVIRTWLFVSCGTTCSNAFNSHSRLLFSDERFLTW